MDANLAQYVSVMIGGQLFGFPIQVVQDVFSPDKLTKVPLTRPFVAGVINLRGRILTAIDMHELLDLARDAQDAYMALSIEYQGESFGLLIDSVGEVLALPEESLETNPPNIDSRWARISAGIYRLEQELMIVLDIDKLLPGIIALASAEE